MHDIAACSFVAHWSPTRLQILSEEAQFKTAISWNDKPHSFVEI
jgi:hypothetical protein